jgi:hypothetical protein
MHVSTAPTKVAAFKKKSGVLSPFQLGLNVVVLGIMDGTRGMPLNASLSEQVLRTDTYATRLGRSESKILGAECRSILAPKLA